MKSCFAILDSFQEQIKEDKSSWAIDTDSNWRFSWKLETNLANKKFSVKLDKVSIPSVVYSKLQRVLKVSFPLFYFSWVWLISVLFLLILGKLSFRAFNVSHQNTSKSICSVSGILSFSFEAFQNLFAFPFLLSSTPIFVCLRNFHLKIYVEIFYHFHWKPFQQTQVSFKARNSRFFVQHFHSVKLYVKGKKLFSSIRKIIFPSLNLAEERNEKVQIKSSQLMFLVM